MKYKIDTEIIINDKVWRIAEYRMRFGMQWVYVLLKEKIDGQIETLYLDEKSLDLIIITEAGVLMRQRMSDIRTIGRVTQGVRLVKLDDGSSISSITRVMHEEADKNKIIINPESVDPTISNNDL